MVRFVSPPFILLDIGRFGVKLNAVVARQLLTPFSPYLDMHRGLNAQTNSFLTNYLFKCDGF